MPIKIKSTSGGSVTIDVPSTAVDTTMMLPVTNAGLISNTNPVMTGNVAITGNVSVTGANSYISINGDNLSPYTMKNRIINGDFNFWQRGNTFTVVNSVNTYSADRFRTEGYGANTTISQQSFAGGQTDVPDNPIYYCRVALNNTNTGGYWAFMQRIESPQVMRGFGTYTLSFWVRASSGTVAAGGWQYGLTTLVSGPALTTTWQKVTQTITISSSAYESNGYLSPYLIFLPQNTAALSIDVAHVQVEAGTVATPFEFRQYGQELALCQRYFEKSFDYATVPSNGSGAFSTYTGASFGIATNRSVTGTSISFQVPKRAIPTFTAYGSTSGAWGYIAAGGTSLSFSLSVNYTVLSTTSFNFNQQVVDGTFILCLGHWTASAEL